MKHKKLTREQALKRYWVYQLKLLETTDLLVVWLELWQRKDEKHPYLKSRTYRDVANTIELAAIGWIAQMFEKSSDSVNIIDLWLTLFPADKAKIQSLWEELEPDVKLIRRIRNVTAFHAHGDAAVHIEARSALIANRVSVYKAFGRALRFYVGMMESTLQGAGADFNAYSRVVAEQSKAAFEAASKRFQEINEAAGGASGDSRTNTSAFELPT